jgi:phage-related protein
LEWEIEFYKQENGKIPVLDFLLTLQPKIRAKTFNEIELLKKHGRNLKEPYVKQLKGERYKGIFELRTKFASDINRIFYCIWSNNTFVLLHGFTKKSEEIPKNELEKALNFKLDYERRCKYE